MKKKSSDLLKEAYNSLDNIWLKINAQPQGDNE